MTLDALPYRFPRQPNGPDGRPPWLQHHQDSDVLPIPLPRGTKKQLAIQPNDQVLCFPFLGIHGYVTSERVARPQALAAPLTTSNPSQREELRLRETKLAHTNKYTGLGFSLPFVVAVWQTYKN